MFHRAIAVAAPLAVAIAGTASATDTATLSLTANSDGRWFEYFSDAFAQVDGGPFYTGGPGFNDGFYLISTLPGFSDVGNGANVFPNGANFDDVATLTIDTSGITGSGTELAPITAIEAVFEQYISDDDAVVIVPYTTAVSNVSGNGTYVDGQLNSVAFTSDIVFSYDLAAFNGGVRTFSGTFSLDPQGFDLYADDSYDVGFSTPLRYVWDFAGTLASMTVVSAPEPAGGGLAAIATITLAVLRQSRRPKLGRVHRG